MNKEKHFIANWPELNISVECAPLEDGSNRWIYDWYIEHMPIKYLQLHATVTGKVMYTWVGLKDTLPEKGNNKLVIKQINNPTIGDGHFSYNVPNGLAGGRTAHIGWFYGETYENMPGYVSFRVVNRDIDKLIQVGEKVSRAIYKTKQIITCVLTVKED